MPLLSYVCPSMVDPIGHKNQGPPTTKRLTQYRLDSARDTRKFSF